MYNVDSTMCWAIRFRLVISDQISYFLSINNSLLRLLLLYYTKMKVEDTDVTVTVSVVNINITLG